MTQDNRIISKGTYKYPQISKFIAVKDYIFSRMNDKKCLFLRFTNYADYLVTSMRFTIIQMNSSGEDLGHINIECSRINILPDQNFAYDKAIVVDEYCSDIKVVFSEVRSDDYYYKAHEGRVIAYYDVPRERIISGKSAKKPIKHMFSAKKRRFGRPRLSVLCAAIAVILTIVLNCAYTKPVDSGFSNFTISSDIKITSGERIVTDNFNISFEPNYVEITINQRSVSFKPSDVSEVYNGDFHTASKIEEAEKPGIGLLSEHNFEYSDVEFSYTYTDENGAEQTSGSGFKGKSNESTVATVGITGGTIKIYDGTSDVTDNYVINKSTDTGNLTVLALILHVKPVVSDKVFDGEVITSSSREYEWENFDGGSYEIVIVNQAVSDGVNVNKSGYDVEFKAGDIEVWDNGENITDSFKLVFESAKAFIKPRPVYITTGSAEKEYDGTELNCHSWELHPTMNDGENVGLIEGYSKESIKVNFTGSQTDAGSSENTAIAYIDGNFTVEVVPGTLTVTPCKINIILAGNKSVYNGKPITTGIKYKIDCAVKDKIFVDITQINVINVGESFDGEDDLVYTVQWKDTGEYLDSDNYEVSVTASKIYRTQAEITVASHSFTENYEEGKVYKDNALDVTGLPEGHYFEGKATTSIKGDPNAVTTVPNEFDVNDVKIYNSEDEDVTANFKITPVFGTITVIPVQ